MTATLTSGSEIVVDVEKPVAGGRMLARHDGRVVLVGGAIPGERVRVRVERISKQVLFARVVTVLDRSPDRRGDDIDWACGGSMLAHVNYPRQLSLKSELVSDAFTRIAKMTLDRTVSVTPSPEQGYRMRARLHVSGGRFGFFREGTHQVCDAASTGQLLPATVEAIRSLDHVLARLKVASATSYEIAENSDASERAILIETTQTPPGALHVEPLAGITGVAFADHMSPHVSVAFGSPYVNDAIDVSGASVALTHHVQSFFQGNRYLLGELVTRVLAQVPSGDTIDLYAGVGLFAVALAVRGERSVVAVEGDRSSGRDLAGNAAPYAGAIRVEQTSVEEYLQRSTTNRGGTVLLDPPRTGVSAEALSALIGLKPPRVVYLSCDLATLARDVRRFREAGYTLDHIEAFDLFPNTAHVETLAVLTRD